jgi:dipeptidyl aminopeptidase/acylaminoacyl peptidase
MKNQLVCSGLLATAWAAGLTGGVALGEVPGEVPGSRNGVEKRPMTFADLQRMKRVSDPQISPSGRWVMFSVTEVDLQKNSKVNHLWVTPLGGGENEGREADSSASLRNDKQNALRNDKQGALRDDSKIGLRDDNKTGLRSDKQKSGAERQITFWKEGEAGGRFSPDGRQVLFVSQDGGTSSQIYLAPWNETKGTLGTPKQLTNVSTEADGAIWSPDSQRILFTSQVYPECSEGSSWMEEDNCNKRKDAEAAANPVKAQVWDHLLYRHWNNYVGPKRSHVLVVSSADGNAVRDLTPRQDIGDAEAPTFSLGGPLGYAWAPDSKEIAFVTNVDFVPAASTNNDVYTLRLDTPGARPLKISLSLGSDDGPAYSPDGKWLAFRSQARPGYESDRFRLMVLDRETMKNRELLPKFDRWVDEFAWAPDSKTIYLAAGDSGEEPVYQLKLDQPAFAQITEAGEYGSLAVSGDGETLLATKMKLDQPSEIFILSLNKPASIADAAEIKPKRGEAVPTPSGGSTYAYVSQRQLTDVNASIIMRLDLPQMERFWFTGAEPAKVEGFILRPPNFDENKRYPVKFLIHGGPQGAWGDSWSYRWNPELMAASGYVVVMVNPRGSTGYGQAFVDGVNGDWGGKAYVDLMKGLDYAEQHYPFIDKTRECALGGSYGGFMANWILTHSNRFACIVTHDGMFNPQSAYGDTEELWFNEWEFREPVSIVDAKGHATKQMLDPMPAQPWNYSDRPVAQDPFRKWSPMLSIKNARTPTLVIHSQRDYRLDVSEGLQLFTALQRLNVPSKMLYFPDEGHWILKPQNSKLWYETVGDWCDRWTRTNAYALTAFEGPSTRMPPRPQAGPPDSRTRARMGVSQPAEIDEEKSVPEKTAAPPVEVTKAPAPPVTVAKTAKKGAPSAPAEPAPAVVAPSAVAPSPVPPSHVAPSVASSPVAAPSGGSPSTAKGRSSPAGDSQSSFQIAISAPTDEVQVGADARIVITLRNMSDRQMLFAHRPGMNNPEFSYRIDVRNAAGHAVEETAYGREARQRLQTEGRTVDYVQPGMSTVQTAHLERLVNLNHPGRYTVRVSRIDPATHAVVRSNEVTLNMVP